MTNSTQQGAYYEELASRYLQKKGLTLLEKNFRHRPGEIDLIMQHNDTLVFIEVRFRKKHYFGSAEESITNKKQQNIITTANYFLMKNKLWDTPCRFDTITIKPSKTPFKAHDINWITSAFN